MSRPSWLIPLVASTATFIACVGLRQAAEPPFHIKSAGSNVWAAIDNPKSNASSGANAGFVIGDDGVLVVDTFANAEAASKLLDEIQRQTKLPVRFVVNSHYHADHVAGNRVFMVEHGATVVAQRNVRDWVHTENVRMLTAAAGKEPVDPQLRARMEAFAPPSVVFGDAVDVYLGSREIRIHCFPGHTGGDSVVVIPDAKVIFTGDLFWHRSIPNTIDASTRAWIESLKAIAQDQPGYSFVPGHGDVGTVQDVGAFREYLIRLRQWVSEAQSAGRPTDAVVQLVMPRLNAEYGGWDYFQYLALPNVQQMDAELRGLKRIPTPIQ